MLVKVTFRFLDDAIHLLQILQIPHRSTQEESEHQIGRIGESLCTTHLMVHEVEHHTSLLITDSDDFVSLQYNTQRDGCVRAARCHALQMRNTQDNHEPSSIHVVTGTLISIRNVVHEVVRHPEFLLQKIFIIIHWARNLHPAIWLPNINVLDATIKIPECTHCCLNLLFALVKCQQQLAKAFLSI